MRLENLKEFDWLNEPANVRFDERGMYVTAKYRTDFWDCARYNFRKDDGHLFFSYVLGDFCCTVNWEFSSASQFDQCGAMLRIDADNWFKISVLTDKENEPQLAACLTANGYSDLAAVSLPDNIHRIWYRLKKRKGCYTAAYSVDGHSFAEMRKFYLERDMDEVKVGAYICSPQKDDFCAVLKDIDMSDI